MKETIKALIEQSIRTKETVLRDELGNIEMAARAIIGSLESGGKLLVFGNGGSAADSQHIAAELVGRFKTERKALGAIALTTDTSVITAMANDYGFDRIFSRQIEALAKPGDICLGISTSGNSRNVTEGLVQARSMGLKTIGLLGMDGGSIKKLCDIAIVVPGKDTARIQESHIMIAHIICELVESKGAGA